MENTDQSINILVEKFHSVFKTTNKIFKNRILLEHSYIPNDIVARDSQIIEIGSNLQPILESSTPSNMFITGENGVGKTTTVHYVFKMLKAGIMTLDRDIEIDLIEINCADIKTDLDICRMISSSIDLNFNPKGYSISESMHRIWSFINKRASECDSYTVVFFFDEIDKLANNKNTDPVTAEIQIDILYQISRAHEMNLITEPNCRVGVIAASKKPYFIDHLDSSIKSSVGFCIIPFSNYNEGDLFHILMDRRDAFQPGVLDESLVRYVAKDVADRYRGDARRAIDTLREAGKIAFAADINKIEMLHILEADKAITRIASEKMLSEHSIHDKFILLAINLCAEKMITANTGLIYNVYKWICGLLGERPTTFQYVSGVLTVFGERCLITSERGPKGNTRIFTLTDDVKNALHILYTENMKNLIENNITDLEIIINDSKHPKKSKNSTIEKF
jgi:archaeal cell division control protein 6